MPITVISNFAKVFETVLHGKVCFFNQLVKTQHGFVRGQSTVTNLFLLPNLLPRSWTKDGSVMAFTGPFL